MTEEWTHITLSGERVLVNGKETKEFVIDGVSFELRSVKGYPGTWLIRTKKKEKKIWDEL